MKKTRDKEMIKLAKELYEAIQARKAAELVENLLKLQVKNLIGSDNLLIAGHYFVTVEQRTRTDLDRDAIMHDMGHEFFIKYHVKRTYEIISVRPIAMTKVID